MAAIPHGERAAAGAAQHQPLQQRKALARRTVEDRRTGVCSILRQAIQVRQELLPRDVAFVMRRKVHAPLRHRYSLRVLADFALYRNLPAILVPPIRVGARITRIPEQSTYPAVGKITPHQLAGPSASVRALREPQSARCKAFHNRIRSSGLEEPAKPQLFPPASLCG